MNTHTQPPTPKSPVAPIRDAQHYRHLLGRAKWYIILSGPIALLIALAVVFLVIRPENPELTAQALIGLERTTDVSGVKDVVAANRGREDIMMSRTFLKDVARELSLQLQTLPLSRDRLFDSVYVDSSAPPGTYSVRLSPRKEGEFVISYYDTTAVSIPLYGFMPGSNFQIVGIGNWTSDSLTQLPGMRLRFSKALRAQPRAFTFRVVDIRVAVEGVYRNLTIKRADPDKGINYIAVLLASRDYALAAHTANAIADAFIERNSTFRKSRTTGVIESLSKRLKLAQADLSDAESKLRDFRSDNPQVSLTPQAQQTVGGLSQIESGVQKTSTDMSNASRLRYELRDADSTQRMRVAGEVAELLWAHAIPAGKTLSEELARLLAQQRELTGKFGSQHPLVLANTRSLERVSAAIATALNEYIAGTQTTLTRQQENARQFSGRLRRLPALEMQLGELTRNQKVYADIYSAVLSGYNQAKVADAVEAIDFYPMDRAVAPLPPPADPNQLIVICVLIAILVSFGPVFAYDVFDRSVRSQRQLSRITSNVALEAIPIFNQVNGKRHTGMSAVRPLIDVPCDPNFTREIFDSLLMKVKLRMRESADHALVISSFEDAVGKSTVSANLATAIAMRGHRTLLVDADLRRGTMRGIFKLPPSEGLSGLLARPTPLTDEECMASMMPTKIPNLFVLPCGKEPANPGSLLSSQRMAEFKRFCTSHAAYTVIDTPPLGIVSDAVVIQNLFAHYMLVVRSGKTNVAKLVDRINEFDRLPEKVIGYVLNGASHDAVGTYRRYSKYYTN